MDGIPELEALADIERIGKVYEREFGAWPEEVSHWDPGEAFVRRFSGALVVPDFRRSTLPYIYSYELDLGEALYARLGYTSPERRPLVLPNGTTAMLFAITWLRRHRVKRLVVFCPTYFPVLYASALLGIEVQLVHMRREGGAWVVPVESVRGLGGESAAWLTNPIYCTGVHLDAPWVRFVTDLTTRGVRVVLDECLADPSQCIAPRVVPGDRCVSLVSPHKAYCINALKFAALIFPSADERFFHDWTDVLTGGLGLSNLLAVRHYMSPSFDVLATEFRNAFAATRCAIEASIAHTGLTIDADAGGYFLTCYVTRPAAREPVDLLELCRASGAVVIPGARNHFGGELGFNFRLNLARDSPRFRSALVRIAAYLDA